MPARRAVPTVRRAERVVLEGGAFFEGPRWHEGRWWVSDFYRHVVLTVGEDGRTEEILEVEGQPSGLGWMPDGSLLVVSMRDQRFLRRALDGAVTVHADVAEHCGGLLNDMVVDRRGRAYAGEFGFDLMGGADPTPANLIRVDPDGAASVAAADMLFPNGSVITPDGRTLIVAETAGARFTAFEIEPDGSLTDRRIWAQVAPTPELTTFAETLAQLEFGPDGCTLDAEGHLWAADEVGGHLAVGRAPPDGGDDPQLLGSERVAARGAPARARGAQLDPRLPHPRLRAESLEAGKRLAQALARFGAAARTVEPAAEGEERAGSLERHRTCGVERDRVGERGVEVLVEHAAAAGGRGAGERGARRGGLALDPRERAPGALDAPGANVGLHEVGCPRDQRRLLQARAVQHALHGLELLDRRLDMAGAELEEPERAVHEPQSGSDAPGLRDVERRPHRVAALALQAASRREAGPRREREPAPSRLPRVAGHANRLERELVGCGPVAEPEGDVGGHEERASERREGAGLSRTLAERRALVPRPLELLEHDAGAQEHVQPGPVGPERIQPLCEALGLPQRRSRLGRVAPQQQHESEHRQHGRASRGVALVAEQLDRPRREHLGAVVPVSLCAAVRRVREHRRRQHPIVRGGALCLGDEQLRRLHRASPCHDPPAEVLCACAHRPVLRRARGFVEQGERALLRAARARQLARQQQPLGGRRPHGRESRRPLERRRGRREGTAGGRRPPPPPPGPRAPPPRP